MKPAVIYARVSSDRQKEEHTIASQTEALRAFALQQGFSVPDEWVFEDEGYSGATLIRPGLEKVRDLAAEGQIDAVLVHSPDRLSRKYAYQVLLMEELARNNVETLFIKAPQTATPEDQLLLQFQGMIAEYERAQILERSRRGKRHRALQGVINVLSGAPYGYRYIRKSEHASASYAIIDAEATVVRMIYELYTVRGLSIGAITRLLNEQGVATRKGISRWERSTIWAMLRNPAYKGTACFNKTKSSKRQRITRPIRLRGGIASRDSAHHERPRAEWIEIPVPPIITEETFALAAERLQGNKDHAPRRTITPSVVQGLVSCRKCGYGLYRTSTRTSARRIHYYRCLGSDAWRHLGGSVCDSKPVRQDLLDELVWREVVKLLESPQLIQEELERRLTAARNASPAKRREDTLQRELARVQKSADRLMTAYQEDLLSLDDLRRRMPELRKREQAIGGELSAIQSQLADRAGYLRLAETITSFLARLRATAKTLDVSERQRIVRLLVKEILVSNDAIVIRHAIPAPTGSPAGGRPTSPTGGGRPSVGAPVADRLRPPEAAARRSATQVTFCVRGVISPLLANLFLHYAFDAWMARTFAHIPFERYADDIICHCKSAEEARALWGAIADRFAVCKLVLHPQKTTIVYCKDVNRRGDFPNIHFDFLGFQFRARKIMWVKRDRRIFAHSFQPAASPKALTRISREIRSWALHHRTDKSLNELAQMYNPCIRGWITYYSHFYRTQLRPTLKRIDAYVIRWARRKFTRMRHQTKGARDWFDRLHSANPILFAHWTLCHGNGRTSGAV